jgi:hypothetical protein
VQQRAEGQAVLEACEVQRRRRRQHGQQVSYSQRVRRLYSVSDTGDRRMRTCS